MPVNHDHVVPARFSDHDDRVHVIPGFKFPGEPFHLALLMRGSPLMDVVEVDPVQRHLRPHPPGVLHPGERLVGEVVRICRRTHFAFTGSPSRSAAALRVFPRFARRTWSNVAANPGCRGRSRTSRAVNQPHPAVSWLVEPSIGGSNGASGLNSHRVEGPAIVRVLDRHGPGGGSAAHRVPRSPPGSRPPPAVHPHAGRRPGRPRPGMVRGVATLLQQVAAFPVRALRADQQPSGAIRTPMPVTLPARRMPLRRALRRRGQRCLRDVTRLRAGHAFRHVLRNLAQQPGRDKAGLPRGIPAPPGASRSAAAPVHGTPSRRPEPHTPPGGSGPPHRQREPSPCPRRRRQDHSLDHLGCAGTGL